MKNLITFIKNLKKAYSIREAFRRHDRFWRWVATAAVVVLLLVICSPTLSPLYHRIPLELGQRSASDVVAPFAFKAIDPVAWTSQKDEAGDRVPLLFQYDAAVEETIRTDIDRAVAILEAVVMDDGISTQSRRQEALRRIQSELTISLPITELNHSLEFIPNRNFAERLKSIVHEIFTQKGVMNQQDYNILYNLDSESRFRLDPEKPGPPLSRTDVFVDGLNVREYLEQQLSHYYPQGSADEIDRALNDLGRYLLIPMLRPNITYNSNETLVAQIRAQRNVRPPYRQIKSGDVIAAAGRLIGEREFEAIATYNSIIRYSRIKVMVGHLLIILAIAAFLATYVRKFHSSFPLNTANVLTIALPLLLTLLIGRIAVHFFSDYGGYFFFAGTIGILMVIIVDARLALMVVIAASILFGLTTNLNNLTFVVLPIFSGFAAVMSLYNVRKRQDILAAGLWIAMVNAAVVVVMHFISRPGELPDEWAILCSIVNGLLSSFISYPMLVMSEYFFGITTDLKLLELTGLMHPALLDLEDKAPGSYQHSLNVTKLAEAAADDIGANTLLVRAGGYFHDIGKMVKPKYFSENQVTPEERNVHRDLSPFMSCLIIKNHVKEGIELARTKYKLPERVIDFIPQHQGTSLIRYFYHQAVKNYEESSTAEPVSETEFRYPGPSPQTIEAGVLMLADTVEATATSKLTESMVRDDDIRLLVRDSIQQKFAEGQFDECPLTLRDLYTIGESFVKSLRARYHHRVVYPEKVTTPAKAKSA